MLDYAQLTVPAPAKLNLHLSVLDRRPDGFHDIESIFLAVDFCDTLHFLPVKELKFTDISMKCAYCEDSALNIPVEKNLIFGALSLFREKTHYYQGFSIKAEKRIPAGSGLGGGSSNAAATLLFLNKLAGFPLTFDELLKMAGSLGSDVPFFIHETAAAKVTGRGECVTPIEAPYRHFVLVNPGFTIDTSAAFRLFDEYREHSQITERSGFSNDFLECFNEPEKTVYNTIISELLQMGADFAGLSGSGSTCFGAFKEKLPALSAVDGLYGKWKIVKYCGLFTVSHCERQFLQ